MALPASFKSLAGMLSEQGRSLLFVLSVERSQALNKVYQANPVEEQNNCMLTVNIIYNVCTSVTT